MKHSDNFEMSELILYVYHQSRQRQSFKSLSTCPDYTIDMYQLQNGLNGLLEIGYLTFLMHENGMASI